MNYFISLASSEICDIIEGQATKKTRESRHAMPSELSKGSPESSLPLG